MPLLRCRLPLRLRYALLSCIDAPYAVLPFIFIVRRMMLLPWSVIRAVTPMRRHYFIFDIITLPIRLSPLTPDAYDIVATIATPRCFR